MVSNWSTRLSEEDHAHIPSSVHRELISIDPDEAEIEHANPPVVPDNHVGRLDVAVDQPGRMQCGEADGDLSKHDDDVLPRANLRHQPALERGPRHEFHGDEQLVIRGPDLVNRDEVGVRDLGHRLGFTQQSFAPTTADVPDMGTQDLDSEVAIERVIVSGIDDTHTAGAEAIDDSVAPDGLGDCGSVDVVGQGLQQ